MIKDLIEKYPELTMDSQEWRATHEEICDGALLHYEALAKECCHWNSVVPKAIEFYKKYGKQYDKCLLKS